MHQRFMAVSAATILCLVLAACGGTTAPGTDDEGADTGTDPTTAATGAPDGGDTGGDSGDATASVDVTITGGEVAGSYSGSVSSGGCSRNPFEENSFGLQYSTDEQVELSSIQLVARDADAAASGGSDDFTATFTVGDLFEGVNLDIAPQNDRGSGTVTIDDRGDTATIQIEGETSEGVAVDATIECHTVTDLGG
ncbi:MAG TPA: hypothetical protein VM253_03145 [Candidatus Limnocylindrales bacterium]|jgi:hypothetical protein|nr:hypothetical protein [Candidatus Limnocylindrales bacterium]